jgi:hypothetical protein
MQTEIGYLKKSQGWMIIALAISVISFALLLLNIIAVKHWALERDNVACIPADVEHAEPMVYRQTTIHPTEQDSLLKEFVDSYIHLTQDEQIVDYHSPTSDSRYKDARLNYSRWGAISMSEGIERSLNMKRYSSSDETFYTLKRGNVGWVFNIDDILIHGAPQTGTILAVVRGEFQMTYDKVKLDLPAHLWGYREIHLLINQGIPRYNEKDGKYENKYGWYVTWSHSENLTPAQKEKLSERSSDYYLSQDLK